MVLHVDIVAGGNADKARAHLFGIEDARAGFDAICFCLVRCGDGAGIVAVHGDNGDRFAA